jgi:hypothetical protein
MITEQEKFALKVECIRAAAALMADPQKGTVDPKACATVAWRLYQHLQKNGLGSASVSRFYPHDGWGPTLTGAVHLLN